MLDRARPLAAAGLLALLSACAPTLGPPPPGMKLAPPDDNFHASDFAWSQVVGPNAIVGRLAPQSGPVRYTCSGQIVVLTPETPWSRHRMAVLYKSDQRSAMPASEVRARSPQAPPGNSDPFIKRAICDGADRFSFAGLPDGAWFVITQAKPVGGGGETMAFMRRVVTRGGRVSAVEL